MAYRSLNLTVYQHTNANNLNDPNIGFFVCYQPNFSGVPVRQFTAAQLLAAGAAAGQPYATLALAQTAVAAIQAYEAAQLAALTVGQTGSLDALVYGPIAT